MELSYNYITIMKTQTEKQLKQEISVKIKLMYKGRLSEER